MLKTHLWFISGFVTAAPVPTDSSSSFSMQGFQYNFYECCFYFSLFDPNMVQVEPKALVSEPKLFGT